jgi:hypothetical protein
MLQFLLNNHITCITAGLILMYLTGLYNVYFRVNKDTNIDLIARYCTLIKVRKNK